MGIERYRCTVQGIVQGVGFRPYMVKRALLLDLTGFIFNTNNSVCMEVQGDSKNIRNFIDNFQNFVPVKSVIDNFSYLKIESIREEFGFKILESDDEGLLRFSIPPDLAMCDDCRNEFNDKDNRRYLFPFISCGSCGPRYSYIKKMPYDRSNTSMSYFAMCKICASEYENLDNRRYHIEGFCCSDCGPVMQNFEEAITTIKNNNIVAIKGLGGYHIACRALNDEAISTLRKRKNRPYKPFAVMYQSIDAVKKAFVVSDKEIELLRSPVSPILLLPKSHLRSELSSLIAPDNPLIGVMVPYTPLHQLILDSIKEPLVMTSANVSGDPLIIDDEVADKKLSGFVDVVLSHNRKILNRADDSIMSVYNDEEICLRKGRGLIPRPIVLEKTKDVLAVGAELKSTVSVVFSKNLVTSNHIGDLTNLGTYEYFLKSVDEFIGYYSVKPSVVVADKHPQYASSGFAKKYSEKNGVRLFEVQHHYSHFVSCYFENKLIGPAVGIILDGTGYGDDGCIWGGEILLGDLHEYKRLEHLAYFPLIGGDSATMEPVRVLAAILEAPDFLSEKLGDTRFNDLMRIKDLQKYSPLSSSMGRLFDAVASLLGFARNVTYEAEAAIFLENLATGCDTDVFVDFDFDTKKLLKELFMLSKTESFANIAGIFHNSVINCFCNAAQRISANSIKNVVLSGGVFQNRIILNGMVNLLREKGLNPYYNRIIPTNDAGISVGQAIYAVENGG